MHNRVELNWVGGTHMFALNIGELRSLQINRDSGPEEIMLALNDGSWRVDDLWDILRFGLIGGGMKPQEADTLVADLFTKYGLLAFKLPAQAVLAAALAGVDGDQVGEPEGVEDAPENGSSPSSTETAQ